MKSCGLTVPSEPPDLWPHLGGVGSFGYAAHEIERIPMIFLEISQRYNPKWLVVAIH